MTHSFKKDGLNPDTGNNGLQEVVTQNIKGYNIKTVKLPPAGEPVELKPNKLKEKSALSYNELRNSFKDRENVANSRFHLNELSKTALSVQEEEEYRIEGEVQKRVKTLFERLYKKVSEDAYHVGFAKGQEDGRSEIIQNMLPLVENFEKLHKGFESAAKDIAVANEDFITKIVYQIAKKVIMREVKEDKDYIKRALEMTLDYIGTRENIKMFVPMGLVEDAEKLKTGLQEQLGQLKNFSIEEDPSLTVGGCRVETDFGSLDSSIEAQLEKVKAVLEDKTG